MIFVHGWPDTAKLFQMQVEHFAPKYRCICIDLPAFAANDASPGNDFPVLVARLTETLRQLKASPATTVLVGHDWGAYLVYLFDQTHPGSVSRLVTMDVGAHFRPHNVKHGILVVSYQWWLVAAFFIGKILPPLGNAMSRCFANYARAPEGAATRSRMNYPYFYFWRARFFAKWRAAIPARFTPSVPLLYLFGAAKPYHFHSPRWESMVAKWPGSKSVGMKKCDHWLMVRDPAETNRRIEDWLAGKN